MADLLLNSAQFSVPAQPRLRLERRLLRMEVEEEQTHRILNSTSLNIPQLEYREFHYDPVLYR